MSITAVGGCMNLVACSEHVTEMGDPVGIDDAGYPRDAGDGGDAAPSVDAGEDAHVIVGVLPAKDAGSDT